MSDLLIELFSEEIPARMQGKAAADLQKLVTDGLVEAGLTYKSAAAFSTPRRLALSVEDLTSESKAVREERKGPKVGAPEQAIEGFLRGAGVARDALEIRDDKKGQTYFAVIEKPGRLAADIIAEVLENAIRNFPWPKSMRWGTGSLKWVRPLHSIICILTDEAGTEVVPMDVDGIKAGKQTRGHRFLSPDVISVNSFEDYEAKLKRAHVMLRADERAEMIWNDATNQAFALGLEVVEDQGLLGEVAGLVEWPVVLIGQVDPAFYGLPAEVLKTSMKEHQKFFSVRNPKSGQIERFVTVANTVTADHGATILKGNQKVLFARLSDAKFFWENDLRVAKAGMDPWLDSLSNVTFHNKLGSQKERIDRIIALAREIAPIVGADADEVAEAARLAKADLSSEMVYEFAELQGLMGGYYATVQGEDASVAAAIRDHYKPVGQGDEVPSAPITLAVSLAEKLDTLTQFFGVDMQPTGSKDPFALRRAALAAIRLLVENGIRYPIAETDGLLDFFVDRLKVQQREAGVRHDLIDAVIALGGEDDLVRLLARVRALQSFVTTEDGTNLLAAYKRAANILKAAQDAAPASAGSTLLPAEADLLAALDAAEPKAASAVEGEQFEAAMAALALLRAPIDAFFEGVMVNDEDPAKRAFRLGLLARFRDAVHRVADFSKIEG